jgi:F-type H+-transporting ATPase subunit b
MINVDYTVLFQIVFFLVLWFLLNRLVFTPFGRLLGQREQRTEGVRAETESLIQEGERLRTEYEDKIARATEEGNALKEAILKEALLTRERSVTRAHEDAARRLQTAREEIQREVQKGRELAAREAAVIAEQMAEKILGRKIG